VAGQSHGRSEVVALVREVVRVTAVRLASCGGWQRPCVVKVVAGQSHGRSEVVVLVREVLRATAVGGKTRSWSERG
jgi:hypothetical protein